MAFLRLVLAVFFIGLSAVPLPAEDKPIQVPWDYRLGQGLRIADTAIRLGGYLGLNYYDQGGDPGVLKFDDLSLFVFGDISPEWRFFSEIEKSHFFSIDTNSEITDKNRWEIERFFSEHVYSDALSLRIGKFLTPVGTWNEIHADPLTWTVSRPVVTSLSFPEHTTGLGLSGEFLAADQELAYFVYLQNNESIDEKTGERRTHVMYGTRVRWFPSKGLEIAVPLLYYLEYEVDDRIYLTGLDLTYKKHPLEIRAEATSSRIDEKYGDWDREYGWYLEGVWAFSEKIFAVARHEYFRARKDEGRHTAFSIGAVYKPLPQLVFKTEFQARGGDLEIESAAIGSDDRFMASFSILF
ncbi:MAG: hypothetical protein HY880_04680 [Deltaproteobacteria bacterium]|nr:hypothetical protein [Deltaproteobacteria bacterium]